MTTKCECWDNHAIADVSEDSCGCCMSGHLPPQPVEGWPQIAPEGTALYDFQKARTDAMSAMFDRDGRCAVIHTTSKLYTDLDDAARRLLSRTKEELTKDWPVSVDALIEKGRAAERQRILEALPPTQGQPIGITDHGEGMADGYNQTLIDVRSLLTPPHSRWQCGKCSQQENGIVGEEIPDHSRHCPLRQSPPPSQ